MAVLDEQSLWGSVLAELELSLSGANFQTWFKGKTSILSINNSLVEIGCATPYNKVWLEERYLGKIKEIIDRITGASNTLVFTVSSQNLQPTRAREKLSESRTVPLFEETASTDIQDSLKAANVNQRYSFANFIVGPANQLAYAAAKAVVDAPFERYNPLLIYGGGGVGKTHLLHATASAVLLRRAGARVFYCSSETFTNEMIEAIQRRQTVDFRAKYRGVDFLLIDDIQFIAGRESTQEEFFHTFNHLYSQGKQLVFSCDRNPNELANLQERLKNRFAGGLTVTIDPPDQELREAILIAKAKEANLNLDPSLGRLLAKNLGPSVRDLEGGILRIMAASRLTGRKVDLSLVQTAIGVKTTQNKRSVANFVEEIAAFFSLSPSEIKSPRRSPICAFPRQVAMYLLRREVGLSFKEIATELGGRDHTTAIYAVNKVETLVEKGGEVADLVEDLRKKLFRC